MVILLVWNGTNASPMGKKKEGEGEKRVNDVVTGHTNPASLLSQVGTQLWNRPSEKDPQSIPQWNQKCVKSRTEDFFKFLSSKDMVYGDTFHVEDPSIFFRDVSNSPQEGHLLRNFSSPWTLRIKERE